MESIIKYRRRRSIPKKLFFSRNNIQSRIKYSQNSIASYIKKLNLAGFNEDFDTDAFLKEQYNSDGNLYENNDKKSFSTSKSSRKISVFSSFKSRKNSTFSQLSSLFNKKNKFSQSPNKYNTIYPNRNFPFNLKLEDSLKKDSKKKNTLIPITNRRNRKSGIFLTLTDNNDSINHVKKYNFSTIPEKNILTPEKEINYKFITQTNFFKTKRNLRPKTMDNFFKKVDIFNLEKAKKIQRRKKLERKIDFKKKYPKERFETLINNFKKENVKTTNLSKEMIKNLEENKPMIFINKNIEQNKQDTEDIIDMHQLEKQRNSEKVPKMGFAGQINMVNKANSNLIEFGDDYLKLNDIDFYKRGKEIMKKYQDFRILAQVKEKPVLNTEGRYKIMGKNNFIIQKKLDALKRESLKLNEFLKQFE